MRLVAALLVWLAAPVCHAADWSLEIVPSHVGASGSSLTSNNLGEDFHVILTNRSDREWKVWESWNSWGWWSLSFEVTRSDGTKFKLQKGGHSWTWNQSTTFLVQPGRSFVWDVQLNDDWEGFPANWGPEGDNNPVQITAVFDQQRDPMFDKKTVTAEEEKKLLQRKEELMARLKVSPYDHAAVQELMKIVEKLSATQIQEGLWIGTVRSAPMRAILKKAQKY